MMSISDHHLRAAAGDDLRLAGQWLAVFHFQANAAAPTFSPLLSTYHDLLDPSADDGRRLGAAKAMLTHVRRQIQVENLRGEELHAQKRPPDPYGLVWRTTERGAALFMIERLLSEAIAALEGAETSA